MEEWHASISADSTCCYGLVIGERTRDRGVVDGARRCSGRSSAGEDSRAERAHHAENFVVAPTWIESCLKDKIRALVKGIVRLVVVQTSQIAGCSNQGVLRL